MTTRKAWMPREMIRELARHKASLEEIAIANKEWGDRVFGPGQGWHPRRSTVSKKLRDIGQPRRHGSRRDLIPWTNIRPEHADHRYLNMLRAMSRSRMPGARLSDTDQKWIDLCEDLIHGRGAEMVIGYSEKIGWYLTDRTPEDIDIIRLPADLEEPEDDNGDDDDDDDNPLRAVV